MFFGRIASLVMSYAAIVGATPLIYSVSVKNMLGDIQTDCGNL